MNNAEVRIDLHVHSKFSKRPSQWVLQKIGCPESFVEPEALYRIARSKGMTHVTITDHNRIGGALQIAHLPGTFISEEITSYFPEDHCKVHILAHHIDEKQHEDIQKLRPNIFELVDYLNAAGIFHVIAHPLFAVNDRLNISHFERMLLLFKNFELNGSRNDLTNTHLKAVLTQLKPADIDRLANTYDLEPRGPEPWVKNIVGGSDDHSSLNIARTYTVVDGARNVETALEGILQQRARVVRQPSSPLTFAHNLYSIAYQFYRNKFQLSRYVRKDLLLGFLDRTLLPGARVPASGLISKLYCLWHNRKQPKFSFEAPESLAFLLRSETGRLLHDNPKLMQLAKGELGRTPDIERVWFDFVNQVCNRVLYHFASHLVGHLSGANVFNIFHTIGSSAGLSALLAPYFIAFFHFSHDRHFSRDVLKALNVSAEDGSRPDRCGHFIDYTFTNRDLRGANWWENIFSGLRKRTYDHILTCGATFLPANERLKNFGPVGTFDSPVDAQNKLYFPPVMEMLNYCYDRQLNRIHAASPGPIGLAALAVGHMLKIPLEGTYDVTYNDTIRRFAGDDDESIIDLIDRFIIWFYDQMETVFVYNSASEKRLCDSGVRARKIRPIYPQIDLARFHQCKRNGVLKKQYGIVEKTKLLYAGAVDRNNNLHLLAEVYKMLHRKREDLHLVVVGDGPYCKEMQQLLTGIPCTFTGILKQEELAVVYASCDVFVAPGGVAADPIGIARAQAAGLAVIVADAPSSVQRVAHRSTGIVIKCGDAAGLYEAVKNVLDDSQLAHRLGRSARAAMESDVWHYTLSEPLRPAVSFFPSENPGLKIAAGQDP